MTTKHTPGPWAENWSTRENDGPRKGWFVEAESSHDRDTYGAIANLPDGRPNTEANARLIAAAPELLETLKACLPNMRWANIHGSRCDDDIAAAESAIAKAEGK